MKKTISRLPDSELDIMLVLWNHQQESRSVLERLYGNSLKRFVNALYQGEKMKKEDIQELSDFLKEMEEDQEE